MRPVQSLLELFLVAAVAGCVVDDIGDPPGTPPAHNCQDDITYAGDWGGVVLMHQEPKTCPVHLDEQGQTLEVYGVIEESSGYGIGSSVYVYMYPGGYLLTSDQDTFVWDQYYNGWITPLGVDFPASYDAGPWDIIEWHVAFSNPPRTATAQLKLKYTTALCPQTDCRAMF